MTVFYNAFTHVHVRKVGLLDWDWSVSDGMVGPTLIGPHRARTERSARKRAHRAAETCQRRPVGHHVAAVHALSDAEVTAICEQLAAQHIPVSVNVDAEVVHLWPQRSVSTVEEVTVLRAVCAKTDSRIAWHEAVTDA